MLRVKLQLREREREEEEVQQRGRVNALSTVYLPYVSQGTSLSTNLRKDEQLAEGLTGWRVEGAVCLTWDSNRSQKISISYCVLIALSETSY